MDNALSDLKWAILDTKQGREVKDNPEGD